MAGGRMLETIFCFFAVVASCFIATPLKLLDSKVGGKCLLHGDVNSLTLNVTTGREIYCDLGFYSSITNGVIAIFLVFLRWCCLISQSSLIYGSLFSFILATLCWINSVVCTVFMVVGFTEWCKSIKNTGKITSCRDAQDLDWSKYSPQPLDGSMFHTYLSMVEISCYCTVAVWFLVALMCGKQLRQWLEEASYDQDAEFIDGHTYLPQQHPMAMYGPGNDFNRVTHL
ncbi:uncharacterized protein LOC5504456 [Nematostella vectensis]|uniref:uncharacterized protein LOC5504456 n=1 Tax=Nematostella vectensis TaxID=45351 RepID=UPI0013904526|nr:uncharacterized protein LOC5504456 [Nematostella vectensis]